MAVTVEVPTVLRGLTEGQREVEGRGADLAAVIADIDVRHCGFSQRITDQAGLRKFVNVYLNDEDVRFLDGLRTSVADGDVVTILPAVAGG